MSLKEIDRLDLIQQVVQRQLTQREAARTLNLSIRQVKRLAARFRAEGAQGLVSRRRGKPANNAFPAQTRQEILDLVRAHYADFGPTLACEKLQEVHHYRLSSETLRKWMTAEGMWRPKAELGQN